MPATTHKHCFVLSPLEAARRHATTSASEAAKRVDPSTPADGSPPTTHIVNTEDGDDTRRHNTTSTIHSAFSPTTTSENSTLDSNLAPAEPAQSSSDETHRTGKETVADGEGLKIRLRLWSENVIIAARERVDLYTTSAIRTFAQLGRELNKVTGYGEIENLKRQVADQGGSAYVTILIPYP